MLELYMTVYIRLKISTISAESNRICRVIAVIKGTDRIYRVIGKTDLSKQCRP